MARSIHTTQRQLEEIERADARDPEWRDRRLQRIRADLARKQALKRQMALERTASVLPAETPPQFIPILVSGESPYLWFPASAEDVRAVISRLPQGILDGVRSIELCLGAEEQEEWAPTMDRDPFTGRKGEEIMPGVYYGLLRGIYRPDEGRIQVFGFVSKRDNAVLELWSVYLRLRMLSTFVHEAAHHFDHANRVARGRWLAEGEERVEIYAERYQHEWVQRCVVPYLEEQYPAEIERLLAWIHLHGGVALTASKLAGDPRERVRGGRVNMMNAFGIDGALHQLASYVAEGLHRLTTRLEFAREIHWAGCYGEALESLAGILDEHPGHSEAMTLEADIYVHQERYGEAQTVARQVVESDSEAIDAWEVLADAYESTGQWHDLLAAVDRVLELRPRTDSPRTRWSDLCQRARARLELGDLEGALADVDAISRERTARPRRIAEKLRNEVMERLQARRPCGPNA